MWQTYGLKFWGPFLPNTSLKEAKNRLFCENSRLEYCASAERIAGLWIRRDEEERSGINLSLDVFDDSFVPTGKASEHFQCTSKVCEAHVNM